MSDVSRLMRAITYNNIKDFVELLKDVALILASAWAVWRFRKERTYEAALEIGFNTTTVAGCNPSTTFLEVVLTNRGKLMLQARTPPEGGLAFNDGVERVRYGGDLKLKRLNIAPSSAEVHLDWFSSKSLRDVCEINLLSEYENLQEGKRIDFWMEPGEVYRFGVPLCLEPGTYLAKITFIGAKSIEDFWSRIVAFEVKAGGPPFPSTPLGPAGTEGAQS
jgi:hypothetical protein